MPKLTKLQKRVYDYLYNKSGVGGGGLVTMGPKDIEHLGFRRVNAVSPDEALERLRVNNPAVYQATLELKALLPPQKKWVQPQEYPQFRRVLKQLSSKGLVSLDYGRASQESIAF